MQSRDEYIRQLCAEKKELLEALEVTSTCRTTGLCKYCRETIARLMAKYKVPNAK